MPANKPEEARRSAGGRRDRALDYWWHETCGPEEFSRLGALTHDGRRPAATWSAEECRHRGEVYTVKDIRVRERQGVRWAAVPFSRGSFLGILYASTIEYRCVLKLDETEG